LRRRNQGLNFENENLIKKSKQEFNGVEREASNQNSIGIQKPFILIATQLKSLHKF